MISGGTDANTVSRSVIIGGTGITGNTTDTVYVPKLETDEAGEGIIMKSPNGTRFKITVSDVGVVLAASVV